MQTSTFPSTQSSNPAGFWVPDMPSLLSERKAQQQDYLSRALMLERALCLSHRQAEIRTLLRFGPITACIEWEESDRWYTYYHDAVKTEMDLVFELHRAGQLHEYFSTTVIA